MITYIIIAATVLISFSCFNNRTLFDKLSLSPYRVVHHNEWYRLITHGFVHADGMHLFVNMFTYWSFGTYIEQWLEVHNFNNIYYFLLYFGGMIIASLYDIIRYRNASWYASIGASGAVSAILFAFIFLNPWHNILLFAILPIPGIVFGFIYLAYCQYMAKRGTDNINHNAHFYGAVFGFIFPVLLNPKFIEIFLGHFIK